MSVKFTNLKNSLYSNNPTPNQENKEEEQEEEEDVLSLCDLPCDQQVQENIRNNQETEDLDFDFRSYVPTESRMSDADELFFRGKMLPLRRHSMSYDVGLSRYKHNPVFLVTRSESMDHFHSGGYFSGLTSRSSSNSSSNSTSINTVPKLKSRVLNQFHSYPSPSPKIRVSTRNLNYSNNQVKRSTIWRFFQVGLLKTPEIELSDLKLSSSFSSSGSSVNLDKLRSGNVIKKKNKNGFFGKNGKNGGLFGNCKCSVDTIETDMNKKFGVKNFKKDQESENLKKMKKHAVTRHHRTFEWLKQLSVEGGPNKV